MAQNLEYLKWAEQALQAFSSVMQRSPQACPSLFTALDWYRHCVLIRTTKDEIAWLMPQYLPTSILAVETNLPPDAVGLVCLGTSCLEPANSHEQLWAQLKEGTRNYF